MNSVFPEVNFKGEVNFMVCEKCKNEGVFNTVAGQDFYYCRTCKEEIVLKEVEVDKYLDEDADLIPWIHTIGGQIDWSGAD